MVLHRYAPLGVGERVKVVKLDEVLSGAVAKLSSLWNGLSALHLRQGHIDHLPLT